MNFNIIFLDQSMFVCVISYSMWIFSFPLPFLCLACLSSTLLGILIIIISRGAKGKGAKAKRKCLAYRIQKWNACDNYRMTDQMPFRTQQNALIHTVEQLQCHFQFNEKWNGKTNGQRRFIQISSTNLNISSLLWKFPSSRTLSFFSFGLITKCRIFGGFPFIHAISSSSSSCECILIVVFNVQFYDWQVKRQHTEQKNDLRWIFIFFLLLCLCFIYSIFRILLFFFFPVWYFFSSSLLLFNFLYSRVPGISTDFSFFLLWMGLCMCLLEIRRRYMKIKQTLHTIQSERKCWNQKEESKLNETTTKTTAIEWKIYK